MTGARPIRAGVDLGSKRRHCGDSECGREVDQAGLARTLQHLLLGDIPPNEVASVHRLGNGLQPQLGPLPMQVGQR